MMIHLNHQEVLQTFNMQNTIEFNEWMKKIRSNYYSDDEKMNNAFDKLKQLANNKNWKDENNTQYNIMDSSSKDIYVDRYNDMARR